MDAERRARVAADERIGELVAQVAALTAQVAELLARLGTDSSNSSRPPSSDGPAAKPRSLRAKGVRKPGGQAGRAGKTLEVVADPDLVVDHRPAGCRGCGAALTGQGDSVGFEARQVFDLPPLALVVTEHRLHQARCGACRAVTKAVAPGGVVRQVQYGPGVQAWLVNFHARQYGTYQRGAEHFEDTFGQPVSPATIAKFVAQAALRITGGYKPVAAAILAGAEYAHADETGFKVDGKTHWAHSISNPAATWIEVHEKRGKEAVNHIGIIPKITGVLIHDAWAPYDSYQNVAAEVCLS
ncbi:MAG: transposase [Promicromonosporaceae bacterium]|nr:transposase [Promicromonosporaceae bacterium]